MKQTLYILLVFPFFLSSCKKEKVVDTKQCGSPSYNSQVPEYYTLFKRHTGWTGGDGIYSFEIDKKNTAWLFGDSWYGEICDGKRIDGSTLSAHSTVAIQSDKNPNMTSLKFYFGGSQQKPESLFQKNDSSIMWPQHGIMLNNKAYIFFNRVEKTSSNIGFKYTGNSIAVISNPLSSPNTWQYTWHDLKHGSSTANIDISYGTAVIQKADTLYVYGSKTDHNTSNRYMVLSKVPSSQILQPDKYLFYDGVGWTSNAANAAHIMKEVATEYSVSFSKKLNKYIFITSPNGFSQEIVMAQSDNPWRPWSAPVTVYKCPEMDWDNEVFCYAAKGHIELSNDDELLISYCTNSFNLSKIVKDARYYYPRFIKIPLQ